MEMSKLNAHFSMLNKGLFDVRSGYVISNPYDFPPVAKYKQCVFHIMKVSEVGLR